MNMKINNQALQVAGSTYQSRLIVGSGKYKDFQENLAALGALIIVIVIFFPEGIMGWLREKYPERFGEVVDEVDRTAQVELT